MRKINRKKSTQIQLLFLHVDRSLQMENKDLRKLLGPKAYIPFYTKNNKLKGCNRAKGLRPGAINCRTSDQKIDGKLTEDKGYFSKFVCTGL